MRIAANLLYRFNLLRLKGSPEESDLEYALQRLDQSVDLEGVYAVLGKAKQERALADINAIQIDWRREWEDGRNEARQGIRAARRFLERFLTKDDVATLDRLSELIKKVEFPPGPKRRKKPGNPPAPWIAEARTALQRLGVSKNLADDLLCAVGLRKRKEE